MNEVNIINDSCKEIGKIKKLYWIFHNNFVSAQKTKREGQWRIDSIALATGTEFKYFNIDVTDWQWDENIKLSANGPACGKKISGFMPKLNEFAESYFNEMSRRNMVIAIETFDDTVYLFGGTACKTKFTFDKSISGRNGYNLEFTNAGDESSLIINDTDHFPAAPYNPLTNIVASKWYFNAGDTDHLETIFDSDDAGTYQEQTTDGSSGTITYSIDTGSGYGAYGAFVNPTTFSVGDKIKVKRSSGSSAGWVKLRGMY